MNSKTTEAALDYMHIGASRAASSWLWRNLKPHPEIRNPTGGDDVPKDKNVRFWNQDVEIARGRIGKGKPLRWYKEQYRRVPGQINVDMTDSNSWIPKERIQQISENFPDVKISYCIRNPIDTMWSHLYLRVSKFPNIDFMKEAATIREVGRSKYNKKKPINIPWRPNVAYQQNYENWSKYFDVYCFLFDDVIVNPKKIFQSIADMTNIDNTFWDDREDLISLKQNASKGKPKMFKEFGEILLEELDDEITFIEEYFDRDFSHWRDIEYYDTQNLK